MAHLESGARLHAFMKLMELRYLYKQGQIMTYKVKVVSHNNMEIHIMPKPAADRITIGFRVQQDDKGKTV